VLTDQKAIDFFTDSVILVKANAEKKDSLLAKEYSISGYPTLVLVKADGTEIDRIIGYMDVDPFLKTIVDYENGIGTLADMISKFEANPDRMNAYEIADKYKYSGRPEEADTWYGKVIELGDPTDSLSAEARMSQADMIRRAHEWDKALDAYMAVEKDFPGTMQAQDCEIYIAIVYRDSGDTTKAVAQFKKYIAMFPESPDVDYCNRQLGKLTGTTEAEKN